MTGRRVTRRRLTVRRPGKRRRGRQDGRRCLRQRAAPARGVRERRQCRFEREVLAAPGVDAAEQRLDQPVDYLRAEPPADPAGHRLVAAARGVRQAEILPRSRQPAARQDAGGRQLIKIGGHAHELPPRQRPDLAARPDSGRSRAGRLKLASQAEVADQADALRTACEQRLGTGVDGYAADLRHR